MKWEYKTTCEHPGECIEALLNELGAEGWELVSAYHDPHKTSIAWCFLKRPLLTACSKGETRNESKT
jgi:hypothetical protein